MWRQRQRLQCWVPSAGHPRVDCWLPPGSGKEAWSGFSHRACRGNHPTSALILDICPPSRITREYTCIAISHPCCGSYSSPGELIIHGGDGKPTIVLGVGKEFSERTGRSQCKTKAGLLNVLLSRATAPPYGITLEIKRDSIDRECLVQLPQWRTFSLLMLKGTLPLTLKMNWREAAFGPVILVVWRYLRVQAFCLWLVRLSSRFFGYFPICFVG